MPSKDPCGKRLSGAQQRKAKKQVTEKLRLARPATGQLGKLLKKIGPPPQDPTEMILWSNRVAGALAWAVLTDPQSITSEQFRQAKALLDTVGMLYPRAEIEKLLKQILEQRKAGEGQAGLTPVQPGTWTKRALLPAPVPAPALAPSDAGSSEDPLETGDQPPAPADRGGGGPEIR